MDANRFDRAIRSLAPAFDRRASLRGLIMATLTVAIRLLSNQTVVAKRSSRRVTVEGPCGNAKGKANRCKKHRQCCTGYCHRKKRCRCRKLGQSCTEDRNCCPDTTGRACQNGVCRPASTCAGLGQSCQTLPCCGDLLCEANVCSLAPTCAGLGESCASLPCCTDLLCEQGICQPESTCIPAGDPCKLTDVCCGAADECAGLPASNRSRSCQDCTAPLTYAGEYCGPAAGNQCCNGDPNAFVGQKLSDNSLVCLTGMDCGATCDSDDDCCGAGCCGAGCTPAQVCVKIAGPGCCNGAPGTRCATLAP